MEARFLEAEPQSPKEEETTSIEARVERYAVNGTVATFVVRASSGPTERTLGVTYEQCRRLHERLRDDGGVLYAARDRFPKQIRGQRLGLRPTPRQAADQSQQLDAWLQLLTRRTDDLPLVGRALDRLAARHPMLRSPTKLGSRCCTTGRAPTATRRFRRM